VFLLVRIIMSVLTCRCTLVPISDVLMYQTAGLYFYLSTNVLMDLHANVFLHLSSDELFTVPIWGCTNVPTCRCTRVPVCIRPHVLICRYTYVPVRCTTLSDLGSLKIGSKRCIVLTVAVLND
jgi:hypothetical protein